MRRLTRSKPSSIHTCELTPRPNHVTCVITRYSQHWQKQSRNLQWPSYRADADLRTNGVSHVLRLLKRKTAFKKWTSLQLRVLTSFTSWSQRQLIPSGSSDH